VKSFAVTWKKPGQALPYLIDFDEENLAIRCGVALNEIGRYDVAITVMEYEEDAEMKKRIWARVEARMTEMPKVFA
jgi:hypothetical protein